MPISSELFSNTLSDRRLYATDASIYQELPNAIFLPKNKLDCVSIIKQIAVQKTSLIPRAGGTSIAGQCVGNGTVVDVSRYMVNIIDDLEGIIPKNNLIRVQPGVILDDLNDAIKPFDLKFAIDISTSNRCMIAGMVGNNAAGSHSIIYGTTRDHIQELEMILSDGSTIVAEPLNTKELENKKKLQTLEGKIYRTLYQIIDENYELILKQYPKADIIRRNTGYPLDYLANMKPWTPTGKAFNLAPFMSGTEGTLAFITQTQLKLVSIPKHRILVCIHFYNITDAMSSVSTILKDGPAAIELMDRRTLDLSKDNIEQDRNRFWIKGDPGAVLVSEFFSETLIEVQEKAQQLISHLKVINSAYNYSIIDQVDINKVWSVRKAGLGLLMGIKSKQKPVAVIEDSAVSIIDLPDYMNDVQSLMKRYKVKCVYYGHVSVGLVHLRPELDLGDKNHREIFVKIAQDIADLIKKYHGSLSGEHGDGRVCGPFLQQMLGDEIYKLHQQIKKTFDPDNIFNPGKILAYKPIDINLRVETPPFEPQKTGFNWTKDLGLDGALRKCNGTSTCRKSPGRGIMCPSYHASKNEQFSTRGRANLMRFAFSSNNLHQELQDKGLNKAMKFCLSCKACQSECPSNVDMARLKAEYLYQQYQHNGIPIRIRLISLYPAYLKIASKFSISANMLQHTPLFRKMIGGSQRLLPEISKQNLSQWWNKKEKFNSGKPVILLIDIFTHYLEPEIVISAIQVLEATGHKVNPLFMKTSPRQLISNGLLTDAKKALQALISQLSHFSEQSILGIEPSEFLTLKDEATDLLHGEDTTQLKILSAQSQLFDEYLLQYFQENPQQYERFAQQTQKSHCTVQIHTHCHQKSLQNQQSTEQLLKLMPNVHVNEMNTGCCGMAGQFGYENPEFSRKVAETSLLPALKIIDRKDIVIASGTSCRNQINDLDNRKALHVVQFIANRL